MKFQRFIILSAPRAGRRIEPRVPGINANYNFSLRDEYVQPWVAVPSLRINQLNRCIEITLYYERYGTVRGARYPFVKFVH